MSSLQLCAKFDIFPDNHIFDPVFTLAAFQFKQLNKPDMIANDTAGERGLRIPEAGVEIMMLIPVSKDEIRVGTFDSPLEVIALDKSGMNVW